MKLLNCTECHDLQKLLVSDWRKCPCGKAAARYMDDGKRAQVWGSARIIGIDNRDYKKIHFDPRKRGEVFCIPEDEKKILRVRDMV